MKTAFYFTVYKALSVLSPLVLTEILRGSLGDFVDEEIRTEKARPHSLLVKQEVLKLGSTYF